MDRLETTDPPDFYKDNSKFTFKYGQIRNLKQREYIEVPRQNLHSSMDRLETGVNNYVVAINKEFTFQYGQIRNVQCRQEYKAYFIIYIPVWIDQKLRNVFLFVDGMYDLHSSMDRLETYY